MEQDKRSDLIEKFDTGELSKDIIPPNFTDPDVLFEVLTKLLTAENRQAEVFQDKVLIRALVTIGFQ